MTFPSAFAWTCIVSISLYTGQGTFENRTSFYSPTDVIDLIMTTSPASG